jgi:hypothetical protein
MKYIIVLLAALLTFSCSNMVGTSAQLEFDPDTDLSYRFSTPEEAWGFIDLGIKYRSDRESGFLDYWQSPTETAALLTGDCEDKAILFMHLLDRMGFTSLLVIALYPNGLSHAFVRCGDELFGAIRGYEVFEIQKELSYTRTLLSLDRYKRKL